MAVPAPPARTRPRVRARARPTHLGSQPARSCAWRDPPVSCACQGLNHTWHGLLRAWRKQQKHEIQDRPAEACAQRHGSGSQASLHACTCARTHTLFPTQQPSAPVLSTQKQQKCASQYTSSQWPFARRFSWECKRPAAAAAEAAARHCAHASGRL